MKGQICFEDAKTGKLCLLCQAKLKAGIINENEVKVWQELVKMNDKKFLSDLELLRCFELNNALVLVCKGNIGALIGKAGKNIKEMEKNLGKKIRIVEKTGNAKETAQALLGFAKIMALNKVFKAGGEEQKIIIAKQDEKKIFQKEEAEKILSKILGIKTTIEFA